MFVCLYRVSTLELGAGNGVWDTERVKRELDFGQVAGVMGARYAVMAEGESEEGFWALNRRRCAVVKSWWESKVRAGEIKGVGEGVGGGNTSGDSVVEESTLVGDGVGAEMDFLDDAWMREWLSGDGSFGFDSFT